MGKAHKIALHQGHSFQSQTPNPGMLASLQSSSSNAYSQWFIHGWHVACHFYIDLKTYIWLKNKYRLQIVIGVCIPGYIFQDTCY